jgi:hypothetical protein
VEALSIISPDFFVSDNADKPGPGFKWDGQGGLDLLIASELGSAIVTTTRTDDQDKTLLISDKAALRIFSRQQISEAVTAARLQGRTCCLRIFNMVALLPLQTKNYPAAALVPIRGGLRTGCRSHPTCIPAAALACEEYGAFGSPKKMFTCCRHPKML